MLKSTWLLSAAVFSVATPAFSQATAQSSTDTDKSGAQATQGATSEAAAVQDKAREQQPVDTSDIIVTATRRNEALSDVPMAVSAVTAQTLRYTGASDIRQLQQVSPSLLVSSSSSESTGAVARIRGIGTVGDNVGLESSVGVFIDGVYRNRTGVGLSELGPIDRIEVLRGPQGTLFGRNTSAGLISIITAKPRFTPEVDGQVDIGNYDERRFEGSATGPLSSTIAARLDGVYLKRDGFFRDVVSGRDVNDRNRWLLRGQLLFKPSDQFSFRLIGDYSKRNEECCAASYLPTFNTITDGAGGYTRAPSSVAAVERALGADIEENTFDRKTAITPGRDYDNRVKDYGLSGEAVYDLGGAELTSITAYRYDNNIHGQDADYNNLDLLYRSSDGGSYNRFKTFSQELRLQGNTFNNRLDWLVGGYYANEKLRLVDNLSYGADYGRYANCLLFASVLPAAVAPTPTGNCVGPALGQTITQLQGGIQQLAAAIAQLQAIPNPTPQQLAQLQALVAQEQGLIASATTLGALNANPANPGFGSLAAALGQPTFDFNGVGLNDRFDQTSNNWALFTHDIISLTDQLKLTVGARYTHEQKRLVADLHDNNTLCPAISSSPLAPFQQLPCVIAGIPGGALALKDKLTESKLSGTVVLSYKPTDRLLTYASWSRGYKAGGFNLDRSALWRANSNVTTTPTSGSGAICISAAQPNCSGIVASGADLAFKPETNDAFEIGAKYNGRGIDINVAVFRQLFKNFQLNTFNGLNFIVENINSCSSDLGGADTDSSSVTGACNGKSRAGVENRGVEIEAFTRPMPDLAINAGMTFADTRYRKNLIGANGSPLNDYLFQLPDRRISNAPEWTTTGSIAWTPRLGAGGLRGLIYVDARHMSQFNTGSDLDIEKTQKAFTVVNARVGIEGPNDRWGLEVWAQNLFNTDYRQVAFDAPVQGSGTTRGVEAGFYPASTQLYGAFLGEPRTFGVTLRGKLGFDRPAAAPYVAPPAPPPPPPAPATQTCADGTVILATDACPAPPPPPAPPPATNGERG